MEPPQKKGFNIRFYFIAYVFAIMCITIVIAGIITFLLNRLISFSIIVPGFIWILFFSVVLGTVATMYLSEKILLPIITLSDAMRQVASGDFSVTLQSGNKINEIKDAYINFNLMVKKLNATETLQSDFVSNVSHEFKTPINAIEGYTMLLQDTKLNPEEQREYAEKILINTMRLSELVGNILLLSKVDNQVIQTDKTVYRLDEQIRQAILMLEHKWTAKEIEFDVDMAQVTYCGNKSLLHHVWTNLIDNAVKFGPVKGCIKIRLLESQNRILFEIEDNGPGIPESKQAYIFDKFYQAEKSHKDAGNGLGLALAKRILSTCGGEIHVKNLQGSGCIFTVILLQL